MGAHNRTGGDINGRIKTEGAGYNRITSYNVCYTKLLRNLLLIRGLKIAHHSVDRYLNEAGLA